MSYQFKIIFALNQDIEKWLRPTLEKEKLKNYQINVYGSSEKGDGYMGDISFVEVTGETDDDKNKTYNFVIKSGKNSLKLREMMPIKNAFENEIYFYNEILTTFAQFQKEKGIKEPFNHTPKCYDSLIFDDMEVLILENMKNSGYHLWDRTKPMDEEHIRAVVKAYGKLHALSFALRDQKPEIFKKLTEHLQDVLKLIMETIKPQEENKGYKDIINLAKEKKDFEIVEKALKLKTRKITDLTDPGDPYAVILHGDCWNNNFMFKYEFLQNDQKIKLAKVCLMDFQISRLASPVFDLSYFLFTCISEEDVNNFDEIVEIYYDSFSNFLRQLGSDPDKLFPFEELSNQWCRFARFGLLLMPSIIKMCLSEKEDVSDLAEAAESGVEISDAFAYTVKKTEEYGRRTLPVMRLAIDKNFV